MIAAVLALAASVASAGATWQASFEPALEQSLRSGRPLLVEFGAPWCYSCYYMERRVLSADAFSAAARQLELLRLDVDTGEGRALKERYGVAFLPTFLVLDGSGRELGRVIGEQAEGDFLGRLSQILAKVPERADETRVEGLRRAARAGDLSALGALIARPANCQQPQDFHDADKELARQPEPRQRELRAAEAKVLERLATERLFVPMSRRCADWRTGVQTLADVYGRLGRDADRKKAIAKAVDRLEADGLRVGDDRNHDDNLRLFLELSGDDRRALAFYDHLLAAYPSDYVYEYRLARFLHGLSRPAQALPHVEKALPLAYGSNRFQVIELRASILQALGREKEAQALLEQNAKDAADFSASQKSYLERLRGR